MALFRVNGTVVKKILVKDLDLEKNLQVLFEKNLEEILNITFLAHEYITSFGGRIDTLGIDRNGSPCIIEYKKNQNDNVINQGLSYLRWLIDHKADFEVLCNNKNLDIKTDWDSVRVICIAESYNKFDIDTADLIPNIELYRYRIYEDSILYLERENYSKIKSSTSVIFKKSKEVKTKNVQLQKSYTIDDHLNKINKETLNLFNNLREKILSLDQNIVEEAKAKYIAYKLSTNFVDIVVQQKGLIIYLNISSGQLNDPTNIAKDLTKPKVGHWGNGDYSARLDNEIYLDHVFELVKQSYFFNK